MSNITLHNVDQVKIMKIGKKINFIKTSLALVTKTGPNLFKTIFADW